MTDKQHDPEQPLEEEDDWDVEYDPNFPNPHMVEWGLEHISRLGIACGHSDDPEIKRLMQQAIPLLCRARELNDQKIADLGEEF